ncbi:MAG: GWxTD domain-containing protein, partial [Calditrichaeota bacterium]
LRVATFEETNARNRSVIVKDQFVLPAGQYTLLARSTDLVTNKSAKRKIKLKFADYSAQPVALGSLMFLRDVQVDSSGRVVDFTPTFSNNFTVKSGKFYILYDLFVRRTDQPVTLHYKFEGERARSKKKELEIDSTLTVKPDQAVSQQLFELNRQYLRHNKYLLSVEARVGDTLARTNQTFSFFWSSVPTTLADIDLALRQMSYILNADTLKYYLAADFAQKQAFFQRFWKERDPDPTTRKNELKDEYFKRVNYANNHFSTMSQDGWATDRGRILIKFGYPDDIERHPFEIDTAPYEVWQYYSLRKTFLFIDYTGFGDYRLDPRYFNMEFE